MSVVQLQKVYSREKEREEKGVGEGEDSNGSCLAYVHTKRERGMIKQNKTKRAHTHTLANTGASYSYWCEYSVVGCKEPSKKDNNEKEGRGPGAEL